MLFTATGLILWSNCRESWIHYKSFLQTKKLSHIFPFKIFFQKFLQSLEIILHATKITKFVYNHCKDRQLYTKSGSSSCFSLINFILLLFIVNKCVFVKNTWLHKFCPQIFLLKFIILSKGFSPKVFPPKLVSTKVLDHWEYYCVCVALQKLCCKRKRKHRNIKTFLYLAFMFASKVFTQPCVRACVRGPITCLIWGAGAVASSTAIGYAMKYINIR